MVPGPCQLEPVEAEILARPIQPHYGPAWAAFTRQVHRDLAVLLGATSTYLLPGTGSAGLDAAVCNLFEPGQRVVVVDSGYFGGRLAEIARAHRLGVRVASCVPGRPADPAAVAELLPGADGLLVAHVETSTGVRHPVERLAALARSAGAVTLVDAVASAGGEHLHIERMGIDAVVTASQKGLGAAAGLTVVALAQRGRQRVESRSSRPSTWFFDFARWDRAAADSAYWEPTPVTMPTSQVMVLASSVRRILAAGTGAWIEQRHQLSRQCRDGLRRLGLELPAPDECAANLVVVAGHPRADALRAHLADAAGIVVGAGLRPFSDDTLRVGLVGRSATSPMVELLLHEIEQALKEIRSVGR